MSNLTPAERMVAVETNLLNLGKKVDEGFAEIKGTMKDLSKDIQQAMPTFVTQSQLTEKIGDLDKQIIALQLELQRAKGKNSLQVWITSSLAAIFAVVLTVLIQSYFRGN